MLKLTDKGKELYSTLKDGSPCEELTPREFSTLRIMGYNKTRKFPATGYFHKDITDSLKEKGLIEGE
jgi:hypothetical protein